VLAEGNVAFNAVDFELDVQDGRVKGEKENAVENQNPSCQEAKCCRPPWTPEAAPAAKMHISIA